MRVKAARIGMILRSRDTRDEKEREGERREILKRVGRGRNIVAHSPSAVKNDARRIARASRRRQVHGIAGRYTYTCAVNLHTSWNLQNNSAAVCGRREFDEYFRRAETRRREAELQPPSRTLLPPDFATPSLVPQYSQYVELINYSAS